MTEQKEKEKWGFKLRIGLIILILLLLLAGFAGFTISNKIYESKQPKITSTYISEKIQTASDLTTAEMVYHGLITYSDGEIPFLTRKQFSMIYSAKVRAGVDFSKIKVDVTKDKVVIEIPDAEIQSIDVDSDSIEFYDEQFALFNWTEKEDITDTISAAREDVRTKADVESLVQKADEQTAVILQGILSSSIGERELLIR